MSSYRSIVLVKQVPDTSNITGSAMKEDGTVNRAALPTIFNPEDLSALEAALEVKDRFGGTVTVVSMGPPKAADVLRDCLYRGADRAILVTDRRAGGSDTLATSYILSQAVKTVGEFDFVFCGRQAIDGDTAQTGPQCAEKLGVPQVAYLTEIIDVKDGFATIRRALGNGWEVVRAKLPILATVVEEANEPRPQAAIRVMRNKHKRVPLEVKEGETLRDEDRLEQWSLDDIGADLSRCGLAGSPTKVFNVQSIVLKKEGSVNVAPTEEGVRGLISELVKDRALG
ncbi:MAG: electron transfer flavoprotein subunit beta/FixA family protein [Thermoguttaceae bacterium]|nr:electron transfer flavoprotein subunit beta/FixA family protein [Thermoguttaceae bacterium]MBQ2039993.1 electron transfer flavoprotein subunit beta/FixA family protein [Thermoguttaceae bacterium]MBQ2557260.1 electron transfer flavoprotein subunit beta/FixA family protein [Thermoguttaceae bacterium]MBQ3821913.1 electron transfer flavoprotein subunit beta/FixA family protein [Thermoguttaceae bacterium]MBQ5367385.1 electron transfer flavoprotein subunit beta/FixA family protein [Thermoguttaceae